jgi:hypothetical protein
MNPLHRRLCTQAWLIVFALMSTVHLVHAQSCPEGMAVIGGQGVYGCAPTGNEQPRGHWANGWGAIATDVLHAGVGASVNQPSEQQAEQAAIANCLSNSGVNCRVNQTYFNTCIAMAVSDTNKGSIIAIDKTLELAAQRGIKGCLEAGITDCRARYTSCSTAQWVQ